MPVIDFPTSPEGVRKQSVDAVSHDTPLSIQFYRTPDGFTLTHRDNVVALDVDPEYVPIFAASLKMREALMFVKDFLINKENASSEGDFLRDIRREAHAPLHAKIDEALTASDGNRL